MTITAGPAPGPADGHWSLIFQGITMPNFHT